MKTIFSASLTRPYGVLTYKSEIIQYPGWGFVQFTNDGLQNINSDLTDDAENRENQCVGDRNENESYIFWCINLHLCPL